MPVPDSAPRLCVVGSVNLDTFVATPALPRPGETILGLSLVHTPGGKGANQAVAASFMGAQVWFVAALGEDAAAETVIRALVDRGLDCANVARVPGPSGAAIVCVSSSGENSIVVISGANHALSPEHIAAAGGVVRDADALVIQAEIPLAANLAAIQCAMASGTPVLMNLAPVPADVRPWLELISGCDVLIVNEGEEAALLAASGRKISTLGPDLVVTTLGERGVRWNHKGVEGALPALIPDAPIIDTVGAGDAFVGAFATRWATARIAGVPMDQEILQDNLRWAMAAGGLACTRKGAIDALPARAEVVALLKRG
jgi:ribokinase